VRITRKTLKREAWSEDDDYPLSYLILVMGAIAALVLGALVGLYMYVS
jgi:hypothetical protein